MQLWQAKTPRRTQKRIATNVDKKSSCNNLVDFLENDFPSTTHPTKGISLFQQCLSLQNSPINYCPLYHKNSSLHSSYKKHKYTSHFPNLLVPKLLDEKECEVWELGEEHYYLSIQQRQNVLCSRAPVLHNEWIVLVNNLISTLRESTWIHCTLFSN